MAISTCKRAFCVVYWSNRHETVNRKGYSLESRSYEITSAAGVSIRVTQGHFSTNHSRINYYVDTTTLKASHSESAAAFVGGLFASLPFAFFTASARTLYKREKG